MALLDSGQKEKGQKGTEGQKVPPTIYSSTKGQKEGQKVPPTIYSSTKGGTEGATHHLQFYDQSETAFESLAFWY